VGSPCRKDKRPKGPNMAPGAKYGPWTKGPVRY